MTPALDLEAKKRVLRHFTYGLYVVTVGNRQEHHGFTANWLTQVSFEPPLVAASVEGDSHALGLMRASGFFGVNVLGSEQRELAGSLGRKWRNVGDKLSAVAYHVAPHGCPLLDEALGAVECQVTSMAEAGDSVLFVGEVVWAEMIRDGSPLLMSEAGFRHSG